MTTARKTTCDIVDRYDTDPYRAIYTTRFADVVYVLHAFQKKSKRGVRHHNRTSSSCGSG